MTTAGEAIERIAKRTDTPFVAFLQIARALRTGATDFWPKGGPRKSALVTARHLACLALARSAPMTSYPEVPEAVATFGRLRRMGASVIPGVHHDLLLDALTAVIEEGPRGEGLGLTLIKYNRHRIATFSYENDDNEVNAVQYIDPDSALEYGLLQQNNAPVFQDMGRLNYGVLLLLHEMAADTARQLGITDPGSSGAVRERDAALGGAAPLNQPRRRDATSGVTRSEASGGEGQGQHTPRSTAGGRNR